MTERGISAKFGCLLLVGAVMVPLLVLSLAERSLAGRGEGREERLQQLEQRMDELEGRSAGYAVDPLVGSWFCTNNALSYTILFLENGQLVAGEAFLGNTRGNNWIRLGEDRISIPGGPQFDIRFDDPDNFSYRELNVGSTGSCKRQ